MFIHKGYVCMEITDVHGLFDRGNILPVCEWMELVVLSLFEVSFFVWNQVWFWVQWVVKYKVVSDCWCLLEGWQSWAFVDVFPLKMCWIGFLFSSSVLEDIKTRLQALSILDRWQFLLLNVNSISFALYLNSPSPDNFILTCDKCPFRYVSCFLFFQWHTFYNFKQGKLVHSLHPNFCPVSL